MKRISSVILVLSLITVIISSCKKEDYKKGFTPVSQEPSNLNVSEFQISEQGKPVDIAEQEDDLVILIEYEGIVKIVKYDKQGNMIFSHVLNNVQGSPKNLVIHEDNYIISTVEYIYYPPDTLPQYLGYFLESNYKCDYTINDYSFKVGGILEFNRITVPHIYSFNNVCDLKWERKLNNDQVGRLVKVKSDKLVFVGVETDDSYSSYTVDNRWGNYPTVTFNYFGSYMSYFELDVESGSVKFEQLVNNITVPKAKLQCESKFAELMLSSDKSVIAHQQGIVVVDNNGNMQSHSAPVEFCDQEMIRDHSLQNAALINDENVSVVGSYTDSSDKQHQYLAMMNVNGYIQWKNDGNFGYNSILVPNSNNKGFYLIQRSGLIQQYSINGSKNWEKNIIPNSNFNRSVLDAVTNTSRGIVVVTGEANSYKVVTMEEKVSD